MTRKIQRIVMALGMGAVFLGCSLAARADDDNGGFRLGLDLGPVRAWVVPQAPSVVEVRPLVRAYRDVPDPRSYYWRRAEARRDWRQHEWREQHRAYRDWRFGRWHDGGYGSDGPDRGFDD